MNIAFNILGLMSGGFAFSAVAAIGWRVGLELADRLVGPRQYLHRLAYVDAGLLEALRALVIESGGKAIPNDSLAVARKRALAAIAEAEGRS